MSYDVIIVGAASAGLTAALYTGRQGLRTLVVSKDVGGQALLTSDIQNYPGIISTGGLELMDKFEAQAKSFGAEFVFDEVAEILDTGDACFRLKTVTGKEFESCALILAFGKTPRDLGASGEQRLKGKGVSYCAVCDGPLFKGKPVAVVGSADQALDAAGYLSRLASEVYLIHRGPKPIADDELLGRVKSAGNVEFIANSEVSEMKGKDELENLVVLNKDTGETSQLKVEGVFVEIGYVARTGFVQQLVQLNGRNEIVVDKECNTSHPGIFAAGDVTDVPYKQAVVSAGQGCIAALSAYNYLQRLRGKSAIRADWKSL
ncbi:MAG: NAD(P)/FAD-dependent oxidoreductase [Candidatus Bathyarchaeia archaeon]